MKSVSLQKISLRLFRENVPVISKLTSFWIFGRAKDDEVKNANQK